jgi:hypothetical protein
MIFSRTLFQRDSLGHTPLYNITTKIWMSEIQSLAEAKDFSSSLCVQSSSEAHPASYHMCTGGCFPRGKAWPGHNTEHSPPSSAEVENE